MASTQYYIQDGQIIRNAEKPVAGLFNLNKFVKRQIDSLHIASWNTCCDTAGTDPQPVRVNPTTGALETYNGTAWVEFSGGGAGAATALTAFATGGQTDATQLTAGYNEVTTVATAGDSVKLPAATISQMVIVKNEGAAIADIFPATGDTINDGAANAAIPIAPGSTIVFNAINSTNWETSSQVLSSDTINEQTAAAGVTVDGALIKDGGISANSMFAGFFPTTAAQAITGAGAVNVTAFLTKFTSSGAAQALTMAAGTQIGQRKKVSHVADGGSGVLTATFVGGTTITFTTVGEFADLLWNGTAWAVLELGNTATPGTPPVLA